MQQTSDFIRPINILLVSHSGNLLGAPKSLLVLATKLDRHRFQPIVIVPSDGLLANALRQANIKVIVINRDEFEGIGWRTLTRLSFSNKLKYISNTLHYVRAILCVLQRNNIDIVYTNTSVEPFPAVAASLAGCSHILHVQENLPPSKVLRWYMRLMFSLSSEVVFASNSTKHTMTTALGIKPPTQAQIIYTGVCPEEYTSPRKGSIIRQELGFTYREILIGMVGKLQQRKGVDDFADAAVQVYREYPHTGFLLVGDFPDTAGEYQNKILSKFRDTNMEKAVRLTGFRTDIPDIMDALDILVVPSRCDPFPWVVLEGMAMGKAIVGSNVDGIAEALVHLESGLLTQVNSPSTLAEAIGTLVENNALRQSLGDRARRRASNLFTEERYISQMTKLCEHIVKSGQSL